MAESKIKDWQVIQLNGWVHVIPTHDDKPHELYQHAGYQCPCGADLDLHFQVATHNAFDFREVKEYLSINPKV